MMTGSLSKKKLKKIKKKMKKRGCSLIRACSLIRSNTVLYFHEHWVPSTEKLSLTEWNIAIYQPKHIRRASASQLIVSVTIQQRSTMLINWSI